MALSSRHVSLFMNSISIRWQGLNNYSEEMYQEEEMRQRENVERRWWYDLGRLGFMECADHSSFIWSCPAAKKLIETWNIDARENWTEALVKQTSRIQLAMVLFECEFWEKVWHQSGRCFWRGVNLCEISSAYKGRLWKLNLFVSHLWIVWGAIEPCLQVWGKETCLHDRPT